MEAVKQHSSPSNGRAWVSFWLHATVFVSSACVMVVELVAGRMVARHLGTSIYTWTSVIGVILAGLALGNYVGGRIADRFPPRPTLGLLFVLSSAVCLWILIANRLVGDWQALWSLAWPARVALHVALVFCPPAILLGTIGPVVARMALGLGRATGRTLGSVYAWGVVGSLVGTFLTGFWLISVMGTRSILWSVAATLALVGVAWLPRAPLTLGWPALLAAIALLSHVDHHAARATAERVGLREAVDPTVLYSEESRYSHLEVRRHPGTDDIRGLFLDRLLHTRISMEDPVRSRYGYVSIFAELTDAGVESSAALRTLTIGGGGYVLPRYLQATWPSGTHTAVEIDPAVTRASIAALGLEADPDFQIVHEDGRLFVNREARRFEQQPELPRYDRIYLDAVVDFAVPHQLTTLEFFESAATSLSPKGALMVNMIDMPADGRMLGSLIGTLDRIFAHVTAYHHGDLDRMPGDARNTFVIYASNAPAPTLSRDPDDRAAEIHVLSEPWKQRLIRTAGGRVLTDDHAPVEQLIAPVVRASATEIVATELLDSGLEAAAAGDLAALALACRRALKVDPDHPEARFNLGVALHAAGQRAEAIHHWRRAIAARPDYAEARHNLAAALFEEGRLDEAITHFQQAVSARPGLVESRRGLGTALAAAGHDGGARDAFEAALALAPGDAETERRLAEVQGRLGESDPGVIGTPR